ncbi:MAG TPA: hypothetical protein PK459_02490 [Anaerolineaceae bacterium]|nr:hypothetical protein [Anaerolineaceae bacterium]
MEHTNPTLFARTRNSGHPCHSMAGVAAQETNDGLKDINYAERLQLSESARFGMDEEIAMLRKMIRNFTRAAGTSGEEDYPDNLAKSLDLLGLTCSRLASVLRMNMMLAGSHEDDLRKQIEDSLAEFLAEVKTVKTQSKSKKRSQKKVKDA